MMALLKNHFRPEFLNRLDDIVVFHRLDESNIEKIVTLQINALKKRMEGMRIALEVTPKAVKSLAKEGYDPVYGARPLKRVIIHRLENPLSKMILAGKVKEEQVVRVDAPADSDSDSDYIFNVK